MAGHLAVGGGRVLVRMLARGTDNRPEAPGRGRGASGRGGEQRVEVEDAAGQQVGGGPEHAGAVVVAADVA
ncbi:hypothetical protein ABT093_31695, partial [Kitasatospora sp. NPDC002551]|uniref:hypothetical protein n=1 Tax=Kitasatospora sp. NPDC002551 TaxID=3154539 RepID=UPI00332D08D4